MSRATILHVEDDSNDAILFQHACRAANIDCGLQVVTDGDEALAYLRGEQQYANRGKYPLPQLVLLDLKTPRMNGFEVLDYVRKDERFRRLPVIVLTSSNHESDVHRAYEMGANSYLIKPVDFDALVELAKTLHRYWLVLNKGPR